MPSFRLNNNSMRDLEIKKFLDNHGDKSEVIKIALHQYINPGTNERFRNAKELIDSLQAQNKILQEIIYNITKHNRTEYNLNQIDECFGVNLDLEKFVTEEKIIKTDEIDRMVNVSINKILG